MYHTTPNTKANIEIAAAMLVLLSAMIDTRVSAGIALISLISLAFLDYRKKE
jgi:hypothetical protein